MRKLLMAAVGMGITYLMKNKQARQKAIRVTRAFTQALTQKNGSPQQRQM